MGDFDNEEQHLDEIKRELARARADVDDRFGDVKAAIWAARRGELDPATIDRERLAAFYVERYGELHAVEELLAKDLGRRPEEIGDQLQVRISALKERIPIVAFIHGENPLEPRGDDWVGRCPFHKDHRLSMYVVPSKGFYHCFACAAHGDIVTYDANRRGVPTEQSVAQLEARLAAGEDPICFRWPAHA